MTQAGCTLLEHLTDRSAMLTHALGQVRFYFVLLSRIKRLFRIDRPDLVVLVDSPAWNFHVARVARRFGIPVLYYIAPQLWAWGAWRSRKLRRRVDKIACILPFEQDWFAQHRIDATYVGHPLFDQFVPADASADPAVGDARFPTVALLPGSRRHEIERLWPPMQHIAARIRKKYPAARFLSAAFDDAGVQFLDRHADPQLDIEITPTAVANITCRAHLTLVASGTATLEVAAQNCPMIIMYYVHPLQWHLAGKWLLKTKHLSLVNILAGRELVPEYMPFYRDADSVAGELIQPLIQPGASAKVAAIIENMLAASHRSDRIPL